MSGGLKVTVAGAGALGLSCALALADAGCTVTVCDPAPWGDSASGVAAGMLAPVFETLLDSAGGHDFGLLVAARDLWPAFAARALIAIDRSGAVAVGSESWMEGVAAGFVRLGLPLSEVPPPAGVAPTFSKGFATAEDWRLEARAALKSLRVAAAAAGVTFLPDRVEALAGADRLVVATGAARGLGALVPELGLLTPIKGQILRFSGGPDGGPSLRGEGIYAAPSPGGLAVGATMEVGVADSRVDEAALRPLIDAAGRFLPALAAGGWVASAGVRAATPDGLPMVGFSRDPKIVLAVGARRNGWLLAPMSAGIVAAVVTGRDPGRYAARFDPTRFA